MTIREQDIKLMASERLLDTTDGGGQMSAVEVVDGVVNNLFPDISRLDRTYGRVNLRKAYAAVKTANRDMYYGAHAIITDAPTDPKVSVLMFTTGSYTDERSNAQDRIESYVVRGPISEYTLLGDQLIGQRMLTLFASLDANLPEVGEVYLLSQEQSNGTVVGETQYVRITKVEHESRTYEDERGTFSRLWIRVEIGNPLRRTFPGLGAVARLTQTISAVATKFRTTQVADASRYYGIVPLDQPIAPGDLTIKAQSMFGQLVPSATVESPVVDVQAGTDRINLQRAGEPYSLTLANNTSRTLVYGRSIYPGTLTINGNSDDGLGRVLNSSGAVYAEVDYAEGVISGGSLPTTGSSSITLTPAVAITDTAHTDSERITLANRGYNYVRTLRPIPEPGTLFIDYMAQGRWYRMRDNGKGLLSDEFGGAGQIDYTTGSLIATLGALPDTNSTIIYTWATPVTYERLTALNLNINPPSARTFLQTSGRALLPDSLIFTWDGGEKTATDNANGLIQGDASGEIDYATGEIRFIPNQIPPVGSQVQVEFETIEIQTATYHMPSRNIDGNVSVILASNLQPKSIRLAWNTDITPPPQGVKIITIDPILIARDNGQGLLILDSGEEIGTVNYTTGTVTFTPDNIVKYPIQVYTRFGTGEDARLVFSHIEYVDAPQIAPPDFTLGASFSVVGPATYAEDQFTLSTIKIDLTPYTVNSLVPGSVMLSLLGRVYIDREGLLYSNLNPENGSGTPSGSIDYATGVVSISAWNTNASAALTIRSALTKYGDIYVNRVHFRTPGAPLRPASFFIRANTFDGTLITATPDGQGSINTSKMQGSIDYETGIVEIEYGAWVDDSSLSSAQKQESWYDATLIRPDGKIWKPERIEPSTMKFNAVVYSVMPLDASILGLDPVRLPIDGRVPIIRAGEVIVIHNTQQTAVPTLNPGQTITLPRSQLAGAWLTDAEGTRLDPELYSVNRLSGSITLGAEADLSEYDAPYTAHHRVEDMALVNEAEINGQLRLVGAIPRAYPAEGTYISSALIFGDLGSRARNVFSQATWNSTWSDQRIGNPTTAQYNNVLYPITVNNSNAIRERWAIIFTDNMTFNVVGETVGVITTGNTSADCTPINPVTGEPYFTIYAAGWGAGWATNNVLRFNTDAAHSPIWIARTTISGTPTADDDSFKLQIRGDAD